MRPMLFALALVVGVVIPANASPVIIGSGAFVGPTTMIDFNTIGNEVPITNQYAGQGVNFSGPIFGMTNPGDTGLFPGGGGGVIASNWRYSLGGPPPFGPIVATFDDLQTRVGFLSEHWPQDPISVDVYRDATYLGTLNYPTNTGIGDIQFIGLEDLSGFNRIEFNLPQNVNQFHAIDDFRFEAAGLQTPEPASLALFGAMGMGLVAAIRRRRSA